MCGILCRNRFLLLGWSVNSATAPYNITAANQTHEETAQAHNQKKIDSSMVDETEIDDAKQSSLRTNFPMTMMMKSQDLNQYSTTLAVLATR